MMARSSATWRRRPESLESQRTPSRRPGSKRSARESSATAATPTTATRASASSPPRQPPESAPPPAPSSERSKKRRRRKRRSTAAKERSKKSKRTEDDRICGDDEEAEAEAKKRDAEEKEKEKDEEEEVVSSAPSSPLRSPHMRYEIFNPDYDLETYLPYQETQEAFEPVEAKYSYNEKRARQMKMPTLDPRVHRTSLFDDPKLLHIQEFAMKTMLHAAKFVLGLSSSVGGEPLRRGSGFWVDWDEENKTGIVLTSAHLIQTIPPWIDKGEYAPDAEVIVHLRDETTAKGHLLYYQTHYSLALFRVTVEQPIQLPSLNDAVKCAQEVFELGRDECSYLTISHVRVKYSKPRSLEEYHCMDVLGGDDVDTKYKNGGPVIDFDGKVVGMVLYRGRSFIPSSILLKCLHLWRNFQCIPRPHLGLQLSAIRLLDPAIVEKISLKCNIDEGLIVEQVSEGSHAEKIGIRVGDVIECFNGECIYTVLELENKLLSICEGHFDRGNCLNSKVDIVIKLFHTCKGLRSIKTLVANLYEHEEVVRTASYPFTIGEGVSTSVSLDQMDPC